MYIYIIYIYIYIYNSNDNDKKINNTMKITVLFWSFLCLTLLFFAFYLFIPEKNANQCMYNLFLH